MVDYMHTKYLGTDAAYYGSVLWTMVHVLLSGTIEANLEWLFSRIKRHYDENDVKSRYSVLKLSMFSSG